MKYQLVLQLPASSIGNYDELIELENVILKKLGHFGEVDGHDMGTGQMNIFILTEQPRESFECIKAFLGTKDFMSDLKVAYRKMRDSSFIVIHPPDLKQFTIT